MDRTAQRTYATVIDEEYVTACVDHSVPTYGAEVHHRVLQEDATLSGWVTGCRVSVHKDRLTSEDNEEVVVRRQRDDTIATVRPELRHINDAACVLCVRRLCSAVVPLVSYQQIAVVDAVVVATHPRDPHTAVCRQCDVTIYVFRHDSVVVLRRQPVSLSTHEAH